VSTAPQAPPALKALQVPPDRVVTLDRLARRVPPGRTVLRGSLARRVRLALLGRRVRLARRGPQDRMASPELRVR